MNDRKVQMKEKNTYAVIFFNGLILLLLAFIILYILQQLAIIIAGSLFDFTVSVYHDHTAFIVDNYDWSHDSVKLIYSTAPVISLFFGFIFLVIYQKFRTASGLLRHFFYWGYFYSFSYFFGSILIGGFINVGFGHVLNWSYIPDTGRMMHTIVGLTGLLFIGLINGRSTLLLSNTYFNNLDGNKRTHFVLFQLVLPLIAGAIVLLLYSITLNSDFQIYNYFIFLCMIFPVLIIFVRTINYQELMFDEEAKEIKIGKQYLITLVVILVFLRVFLSNGLVIKA